MPAEEYLEDDPEDLEFASICCRFFGQFLLQQSAYANFWNNECPAWHWSLQRLDGNATEGPAPMSGPSMVVLAPLNYRFTPTSVQLRRH